MERIYIRLEKREKAIIESVAKQQGMNLTEYVKYKLFDQNRELTQNQYVYNCPSGDRYNYAMAGLSMTNYLLLATMVKHFYNKDESDKIIDEVLTTSAANLKSHYHYTKTKIKEDE